MKKVLCLLFVVLMLGSVALSEAYDVMYICDDKTNVKDTIPNKNKKSIVDDESMIPSVRFK